MRKKCVIEHIFSELYMVAPDMIAHYLKAKVIELLTALNEFRVEDCAVEKCCYHPVRSKLSTGFTLELRRTWQDANTVQAHSATSSRSANCASSTALK